MLREGDDGLEVLVVHRPKYDDWSLPKGKLDDGEPHDTAAIREIHEETGVTVTLQHELEPVSYYDNQGRFKTVRWWLASADHQEEREPDDEVDEVRWVPVGRVHEWLSYDHDRDLIDQARSVLPS